MDINVSALLVLGNFIVLVAGLLGGYFVVRSSMAKGAAELQDRVRQTLLDENQVLQDRLKRVEEICKSDREALEKKLARVEGVLATLKYTLKDRRKLRLEVKDDFVTLTDERTGAEITVPIRPSGQLEKEEKEA